MISGVGLGYFRTSQWPLSVPLVPITGILGKKENNACDFGWGRKEDSSWGSYSSLLIIIRIFSTYLYKIFLLESPKELLLQ